jgi:hypothetical protein
VAEYSLNQCLTVFMPGSRHPSTSLKSEIRFGGQAHQEALRRWIGCSTASMNPTEVFRYE